MLDTSTHAKAYWRGTLTCNRAAAMLDGAMAVLIIQGHADIAAAIRLAQGSYRPWSKYSANTHAGCGVVDISRWFGVRQWTTTEWTLITAALRSVGFAAWHRPPIVGLWVEHIHCVAIGCPDLNKPDATNQVVDYRNNHDGLADNGPDNGPRDWVNVTWETHTLSLVPNIPTTEVDMTIDELTATLQQVVPGIVREALAGEKPEPPDTDQVDAMYRMTLGRPAESEQVLADWVERANAAGWDYAATRHQIAGSQEARHWAIVSAYKVFLGRDASETEIQGWLLMALDYDGLCVAIATSPEAKTHKAA